MAMKGPEHYKRAEELLEKARFEKNPAAKAEQLAEAQVHATLALLAATVHSGQGTQEQIRPWVVYQLKV
jgi:hypothetical protein